MALVGKLEVTIKINRLPTEVTTDKNGWKEFHVDFGKRGARVSLRPRMWNRLEQAANTHPHWIAVITGQMGDDVQKGIFKLLEPNLQVFEYTPKAPSTEAKPEDTKAPDGKAAPVAAPENADEKRAASPPGD
ncbi:hypothetical protein [Polyangium jinanense]|uniref:Uncharacterized protein n=1 Tax=Polyangium jinanense TaxID=2829994 RepID=A0A9X3X762_9BACT|nr:hypothetical protein [Polyangium jinanense]MDC3955867.1 hypothetical protein [Polyangium jinanense]MDC3983226.1 hypothetical protein [Polyangium jinanense]MDC3985194.1 hypothetical protein [Polyangium jinanense]